MEIALTITVAVLSLLLGITIAAYYRLRARVDTAAKRDAGNKPHAGGDPPKRITAGWVASSDVDALEIPAALIGPRCKEVIERMAPVFGLSPVKLLRAAIAQGLTGGCPITEDFLNALEELTSTDLPPPSKPGPSRPS
jgi:hypothetical protein